MDASPRSDKGKPPQGHGRTPPRSDQTPRLPHCCSVSREIAHAARNRLPKSAVYLPIEKVLLYTHQIACLTTYSRIPSLREKYSKNTMPGPRNRRSTRPSACSTPTTGAHHFASHRCGQAKLMRTPLHSQSPLCQRASLLERTPDYE